MSDDMTQKYAQHHDETPEPGHEEGGEHAAEALEAADQAGDRQPAATAELEAELAETKDRMLRALAETENLRRRAARDTEEARKYAVTGFARELLEVSDNLARALESVPEGALENDQVKPLVEGIELTQRSLAACFERQKILKIAPEPGEKFDHNLHQAMFETETDAHAPGSVMQVMQPGYKIADRLLRPAMVGVARKPAAPVAAEGGDGGDPRGHHLDTSS
jgi:molecular chaperone GrpE